MEESDSNPDWKQVQEPLWPVTTRIKLEWSQMAGGSEPSPFPLSDQNLFSPMISSGPFQNCLIQNCILVSDYQTGILVSDYNKTKELWKQKQKPGNTIYLKMDI